MPLCISASSSIPSSIGPSSVQSVIDKLVHTGPLGYSSSFVLVAGKLFGLEEVDNVPCPSWSLGLGDKD